MESPVEGVAGFEENILEKGSADPYLIMQSACGIIRIETATRTVDQCCLRQRLETKNQPMVKNIAQQSMFHQRKPPGVAQLAVFSLTPAKLVVFPAPARLTHKCGNFCRR